MQQNPFHYRLIKARVAETIVKVAQNEIRCISYTDIVLGKKPETSDEFLLVNSQIFNLDKATVQQFQEYSNSFFKG